MPPAPAPANVPPHENPLRTRRPSPPHHRAADGPGCRQAGAQGREVRADDDIPPPLRSVTRHKGVFGGQTIAYTAITGETYLKDKDGKPTASIFSTSYIKDGGGPDRPVTFLFNGGPGSGSLWLHMGAFGPKRVNIPNAKDDGAPPYPITANPDSLLDVTDLVFIDPVGTGFSKALGKTDPKTFWGVTSDAESVAQYIRLWLTEHGRWNAPKFVGGESYGTTRSAAVTNALTSGYNDVALERRHPHLDHPRLRPRIGRRGQ